MKTIATNVRNDADEIIVLEIEGLKSPFGILPTTGEVYRYTPHEGRAVGLRWEAPAHLSGDYSN